MVIRARDQGLPPKLDRCIICIRIQDQDQDLNQNLVLRPRAVRVLCARSGGGAPGLVHGRAAVAPVVLAHRLHQRDGVHLRREGLQGMTHVHAFPSNITRDDPPITRDYPPSLLTLQGRSLTFAPMSKPPTCAAAPLPVEEPESDEWMFMSTIDARRRMLSWP